MRKSLKTMHLACPDGDDYHLHASAVCQNDKDLLNKQEKKNMSMNIATSWAEYSSVDGIGKILDQPLGALFFQDGSNNDKIRTRINLF